MLGRVQVGAPFYFVPDAFGKAKRLLNEFVFGRITSAPLCYGTLWASESKVGLQDMGRCSVTLEKNSSSGGKSQMQLRIKAEEDPDDEMWPEDSDESGSGTGGFAS